MPLGERNYAHLLESCFIFVAIRSLGDLRGDDLLGGSRCLTLIWNNRPVFSPVGVGVTIVTGLEGDRCSGVREVAATLFGDFGECALTGAEPDVILVKFQRGADHAPDAFDASRRL